MRKTILTLSSICVACAPSAQNVQATYVSPLEYSSYSCAQIEQEISRVSRKVSEVSGTQNAQNTKDNVAMGVGLIIFWPALFFLIGDDKKEELGRLKGEYDALEQAAIQKNCSVAKDIARQREFSAEQAKQVEEQVKSKAGNYNTKANH